jgi:hypothetical protein
MSRSNCPLWITCSVLFCSVALFSGQARGEFSLLAGEFDGGEARLPEYWCGESTYQSIAFTVSADGVYRFDNPFSTWDWWDGNLPGFGMATELYIAEGKVTANEAVGAHLASQISLWAEPQVQLKAGSDYTLVVVNPCPDSFLGGGTWLVTFSGAGQVLSEAQREIPAFSTGSFTAQTPVANARCGRKLANENVPYQQVGPIRVSREGTYHFASVRQIGALNTCQAVYSAPFNPASPEANLVGYGHGQWLIELEPGKDYWLVVHPSVPGATGEYIFHVGPPASVRINPAMTGLWADLNTPGQGMYLDVFNSIDSVFMAWFTYDLQRPGPGVQAKLGDPGHRWLTGLGTIEGKSSEIQAVWTSGGLFDAPSPAFSRSTSGIVRLEFDSCVSGRAVYDFVNPSISGVVNLRRPFEDALRIAECEHYQQGPGIPGPL